MFIVDSRESYSNHHCLYTNRAISHALNQSPCIPPGVSLHQPYQKKKDSAAPRYPGGLWIEGGSHGRNGSSSGYWCSPPCVVLWYGYVAKLSQTDKYNCILWCMNTHSTTSRSQKIMSMDSKWLIWQLLSCVYIAYHSLLLCSVHYEDCWLGLHTSDAQLLGFCCFFFVLPTPHHL